MITLIDCGCCGSLHPVEFHGDCRDDANRYGDIEEYTERTGITEFDASGKLQIEVTEEVEQ